MAEYTSIVFLDIDGVLNSSKLFKSMDELRNSTKEEEELVLSVEKLYEIPCPKEVIFNSLISIDPESVKVLNEILGKSGSKVVISSSWRYSIPVEVIDRMLKFHGFIGELVGKTSTKLDHWNHRCRGHEIQDWMDHNPTDHFVILDDDSDMDYLSDHLVQTNFSDGLMPIHIKPALRVLTKS